MSLIFDNRNNLQGRPGLHVFVAGVSDYANLPAKGEPETAVGFGMRKLSSAALSARKICDWLIERDKNKELWLPLATCRLLASPTAAELEEEPRLGQDGDKNIEACTLINFLKTAGEWREEAKHKPEDATFFYFAGHGIERSRKDQVLLLEDFADGIGGALRNAVDTLSLCNGMAPSEAGGERPDIARTQFYFVDACRNMPKQIKDFEKLATTPVFDVELSGKDDRLVPTFFASIPGDQAYALRSQTFFSKALLQCLNGEASQPPDEELSDKWHVSYYSLSRMLNDYLFDLAQEMGTAQTPVGDGFGKDIVIRYLDGPPSVPVSLQVEPTGASQCAQVEVIDLDTDQAVWQSPLPLGSLPIVTALPAGYYRIKAAIVPPTPPFMVPQPKTVRVKPRRASWNLNAQTGQW